MQTTVVNCKVKYIRPQYKDLREWVSDPQNVYIGRKGVVFIDKVRYPKVDSVWANPFRVRGDNRLQVIEQYRKYILHKLETGQITQTELGNLRGKRLGCWCKEDDKDIACHGDVLLELLNHHAPPESTAV